MLILNGLRSLRFFIDKYTFWSLHHLCQIPLLQTSTNSSYLWLCLQYNQHWESTPNESPRDWEKPLPLCRVCSCESATGFAPTRRRRPDLVGPRSRQRRNVNPGGVPCSDCDCVCPQTIWRLAPVGLAVFFVHKSEVNEGTAFLEKFFDFWRKKTVIFITEYWIV